MDKHYMPSIEELTRETKWKIIKQFEALGVTPDEWIHDGLMTIIAYALQRAMTIGQNRVLEAMEQCAKGQTT
jgi:hypothetical protein